MFCKNCGAQMDDSATFCPQCGAAPKSTTTQSGFTQPPASPAPGFSSGYTPTPPKPGKYKKIGIGAVAAAVLLVLILIISSAAGNNPEKIAVKYAKAMALGNYNKATKYMAIDMEDYYTAGYEAMGLDMDESYKKVMESEEEDTKDALEDKYGKGYKIKKAEVDEVDDLDDDEMEDELDSLDTQFKLIDYDGFKTDKVKAMKKITVKITIEGDDKKDTAEATVLVAKVGSKWKVLPDLNPLV